MGKAKVGKRGSVVIPAELRRHHHLKVGTPVVIEDHPDGVLIRTRFASEEQRRFIAEFQEQIKAWDASDWKDEFDEPGVLDGTLMDGLTDECPQAHHMVPRGHTEDCPQARHMVEREAALPAEDFGNDRFAAEDTKQDLLVHVAVIHETAKHFQEHDHSILQITYQIGEGFEGCPTTLGGNRKQGEVVVRILFRDKRLKPRLIATGGEVIQGIDKDTGCRLKLEDNVIGGPGSFCVRISGPDRANVGKAADEHIDVQQLHHSAPNFGPLGRGETRLLSLDEDNRTNAFQLKARRQSEATSVSQTTIDSPPYKEGRAVCAVCGAGSLPSLGRKIAGSEVGHYQDANRDDGPHQSQCTTGSLSELEQGRNLGLDEIPSAQTLDELENRFMQVTIEMAKEQCAEEDKET